MAKLSHMFCAAALLGSLSATAGLAATELSANAETIARAIAAAGCKVNDDNEAKIRTASGLSESDAGTGVEELLAKSLADLVDQALVLEPKFCTSMGGRADLGAPSATLAALSGAASCAGYNAFAGHSADKISTLQSEGCL